MNVRHDISPERITTKSFEVFIEIPKEDVRQSMNWIKKRDY